MDEFQTRRFEHLRDRYAAENTESGKVALRWFWLLSADVMTVLILDRPDNGVYGHIGAITLIATAAIAAATGAFYAVRAVAALRLADRFAARLLADPAEVAQQEHDVLESSD